MFPGGNVCLLCDLQFYFSLPPSFQSPLVGPDSAPKERLQFNQSFALFKGFISGVIC